MNRPVTGNRDLMRELNTKLALRLIRQSQTISQIDLVKQTQLSPGTITSIIKELKERNFVREVGPGQSAKGRKPILLQFNPEVQFVVAAEFYADETHLALFDLMARVKDRTSFATEIAGGPEGVFKNFSQRVRGFLTQNRIDAQLVLGVGVSFEGIVDPEQGRLILSSGFGWRDVNVKSMIEKELGFPVHVESDGGAMVLGEFLYGAGRGTQNLVCLDIDAGIGFIAVDDGSIYRGAHYMAGEIGHTLMVRDGPVCRCGRRGCLEAVASGWALLARARRDLAEGKPSRIGSQIHSPSTRMAIRALFEAARTGDPHAETIIREAAEYLGLAVATIFNYSDPELVILTGIVTQESQGMLLPLIKAVALEHIVAGELRKVRIEEGRLSETAALIGMAAKVCEQALKVPEL